jgi:hypothetical protein
MIELKAVLNRKIHALIDRIASKKGTKSWRVKNGYKTNLKKQRVIKSSLSELSIEEQEQLITRLESKQL